MIIDQARCDTCDRTVRMKANGRDLYRHGKRNAPCPGRPVMPDATPQPAPVETCTHTYGTPGCTLVACRGVPPMPAIDAATIDTFTATPQPVPGEYGIASNMRTLRRQLARAVPGSDVSMPEWSATRAAYGLPVREFYVYRFRAAGRPFTVVNYRDDHYAVFADGSMINGDVEVSRHGFDWASWAVARVVADHITRTATDADREREARELHASHAYTYAYSRWGRYDLAEAYRAWFVANGDPDVDHSVQVGAFGTARPDMIDPDGYPVPVAETTPDVSPEPAPVATPEPAAEPVAPVPADTAEPAGTPEPAAAPVTVPLPAFTVPVASLATGLAYVAKGAPNRPGLPILTGVLVSADAGAGTVTVATFDYEQHRAYTIAGADGVVSGTALVDCKQFAAMVKALPKGADRVSIGCDGARLTIAAGTRRYAMGTMPVEDYPALPDAAPTVGTVPLLRFADTFGRVAVAAGRDDTLPVLTGLQMVLSDRVSMTATDRYRLTLADMPWSPVNPADTVAVLPMAKLTAGVLSAYAGAVDGAAKARGDEVASLTVGSARDRAAARAAVVASNRGGAMLTVGVEPGTAPGGAGMVWLTLSWGPYVFTVRCLDGEFPRVRALLPDGWGARARMTAAELRATIDGVAVVAERSTPVRLTVDPDAVTLAAGSDVENSASDRVPCTVETGTFAGKTGPMTLPPGFTVAFNHQYLLDGIGVVGTDRVMLSVTDPRQPVVLDGIDPSTVPVRYLIMPVRIGDQEHAEPACEAPADATDTRDSTPVTPEPAPEPAADSTPDVAPAEPEEPTMTTVDSTPEPTEPPAEPAPAPVPAYEQAAVNARVAFDAGRFGDALDLLNTIPDGYMVAGKRPVEKIRAHVLRSMPAAPAATEPEPVAVPTPSEVATVAGEAEAGNGEPVTGTVEHVAPVATPRPARTRVRVEVAPDTAAVCAPEPVAGAEPGDVAPVDPAPAVADPADTLAVAVAETAAVATLTGEPATVADPGFGPVTLTYTLPSYAILSAGGTNYRQQKRVVRIALNAARRAGAAATDPDKALAAVLREVVCHVESVDGNARAFLVTANMPASADRHAVRAAVDTVVSRTVTTVVDTVPAHL